MAQICAQLRVSLQICETARLRQPTARENSLETYVRCMPRGKYHAEIVSQRRVPSDTNAGPILRRSNTASPIQAGILGFQTLHGATIYISMVRLICSSVQELL